MMKTIKDLNIKSLLPSIAVVMVLALSQSLVLHEPTRMKLKKFLVPDFRTVISKLEGRISGKDGISTILKIKTQEGLIVEIYDRGENDHPVLVDRIVLKERRDASFILRGEAVSMALEDVDQDNTPEIIVPTFDRDLVAHLQVLKFNQNERRLELVSN
ncbi:MAG: hypothetical protein K2X47_13240 [Bdellovibrionales bacterium]|nr:hypothetical protein [Bdellovibrionales bacterium]